MKKIAIPILNAAWGALLGYVSAWVVWMMIYGIGSRVVSDPQHYELANAVHLAGTVLGSTLGLGAGIASRRPAVVVFAAHCAAGILFTIHDLVGECYGILPMHSWRTGLATHWVMLIAATVLFTWVFRNKRTERPTKQCTLSAGADEA